MKLFGYKQIATGLIAVLLLAAPYLMSAQKRNVSHKSLRTGTPSSVPIQQENKIEVVKFDPEDRCVSVEGLYHDPSNGQELADPFSTCARTLFQPQLAQFHATEGTQSNAAAAGLLKECLIQRPGKETLLVGHGRPGRIWTGNGQINPGKDQSLVAGYPDLGRDFSDLSTPQLTLLGCWVGATQDGQTLVNEVASKSRRVRAQNSVVFCSVDKDREGLYLDAALKRVWVGDTLLTRKLETQTPAPQLLKDIVKPACICVKDKGDMCGQSIDLRLSPGATFPLDKVHLTGYTLASELSDSSTQRRLESILGHNLQELYLNLLRGSTESLVDQIGFCSPSQPGVPDLVVTGNFKLSINGKSKQFDVLGDVIVQDHDHPEVLYWMKNGTFQTFHTNIQTRWNNILQEQLELRSKPKNRAKSLR